MLINAPEYPQISSTLLKRRENSYPTTNTTLPDTSPVA